MFLEELKKTGEVLDTVEKEAIPVVLADEALYDVDVAATFKDAESLNLDTRLLPASQKDIEYAKSLSVFVTHCIHNREQARQMVKH